MSSIAAVTATTPNMPVQKVGADADGDNDGTKAAAQPTPAAPQISKPTETMGNYVNTTA